MVKGRAQFSTLLQPSSRLTEKMKFKNVFRSSYRKMFHNGGLKKRGKIYGILPENF